MKTKNFNPGRRSLIIGMGMILAGCATKVPPNAFLVDEALLEQRQLQSRKFSNVSESSVLMASSDVLQDMGFNLESSETALGVLTASKDRDAVNPGEVVGAVLMAALFGVAAPISKNQRIRVSLVVQPAGKESIVPPSFSVAATNDSTIDQASSTIKEEKDTESTAAPENIGDFVVRVTFQRIITRTDNSTIAETINKPEIYQEFFDKLSKSMFIEAQQV